MTPTAAPAPLSPTTTADLEAARLRLPLDDPDRHALDREEPFARLVIAHPERCSTNADYPNWTPGRPA